MARHALAVKTLSQSRVDTNALLRTWCAEVTGDVLSIGSASDHDKQGRTYREYFANSTRYVTSDVTPDGGSDLVLDVRDMPSVPDGSFDAVFCSGVLEHVDDVHAAVRECYRVLTAGGVFLVGVPFRQRLHRVPLDFWRFTEFGLRYLLRAFTVRDLVALGDPVHPDAYWARAVK